MKPYMVTCTTDEVQYRRDTLTNRPVNMNLVATILKKRMAWYPDNTGIPGIAFYDVEGNVIEHWAFAHGKENECNIQFEELASIGNENVT